MSGSDFQSTAESVASGGHEPGHSSQSFAQLDQLLLLVFVDFVGQHGQVEHLGGDVSDLLPGAFQAIANALDDPPGVFQSILVDEQQQFTQLVGPVFPERVFVFPTVDFVVARRGGLRELRTAGSRFGRSDEHDPIVSEACVHDMESWLKNVKPRSTQARKSLFREIE